MRDRLENVDVFSRIILKSLDWIHVAEDIDRWRALVNTVINLRVP
jgi:hypothetical protein